MVRIALKKDMVARKKTLDTLQYAKSQCKTVRLFGLGFDQIRQSQQSRYKVRKREVREVEELKKTKYIWLKDASGITKKQRIIFESVDKVNYEVSKAWIIKENFRDIPFRQDTKENAFFILAN